VRLPVHARRPRWSGPDDSVPRRIPLTRMPAAHAGPRWGRVFAMTVAALLCVTLIWLAGLMLVTR